jgi:hypothetical protein
VNVQRQKSQNPIAKIIDSCGEGVWHQERGPCPRSANGLVRMPVRERPDSTRYHYLALVFLLVNFSRRYEYAVLEELVPSLASDYLYFTGTESRWRLYLPSRGHDVATPVLGTGYKLIS